MPTASNGLIQLEQGQVLVDYVALTNSGDNQIFTAADNVFSGKIEPVVRPNGIVTGRNLVSVASSGSNDVVDVAAFTAYSEGTLYSVSSSADESITRPATAVSKVNSITMTDAGAIAVIAGTDGATTAFSETRGAAGGPPYIPVDSVEIAQVRLTSDTAAAVTASEIFQIVGQHAERFDFPVWNVDTTGRGQSADSSGETYAHVKMASAMPLSHTGDTAKKVYAQYYTPVFAELAKALDFVPVETTHSTSSTQYYNGTIASRSTTLGQGAFTALMSDGVSDGLVADKDEVLTVKFFPDRNKTPYIITQGAIGIGRTFPVDDQIQAAVTITSEKSSSEFTS